MAKQSDRESDHREFDSPQPPLLIIMKGGDKYEY